MTRARPQADQALAVPVEPVSRLDPTGFDPSREVPSYKEAGVWGIIGPYGNIWTPDTFRNPEDAAKHLLAFWSGEPDPRYRIVAVEITVEAIPEFLPDALTVEQAQGIEARSDTTGTGVAEGESPVVATSDDAPKPSREHSA